MLRPEVWLPPEPVEGGVVGEGGVDIAGADAGHRKGQCRARERIRIGASSLISHISCKEPPKVNIPRARKYNLLVCHHFTLLPPYL